MSLLCALALAVSALALLCGLALRMRLWLSTPQPWPVPTTPAPSTRAGVLARLLRETFVFESLWRACRWTWLFGWSFHLALLLAFLGHLRFLSEPLWPPLPDTGALATAVGVLMLGGLAGLWLRRLLVDRVRHVTLPSDHLLLALLAVIAISGLAMGEASGLAVRDYVWGLLALELRPLPAGPWAPLHLLAASALFALLPWSKLLHGPALWCNPTRCQRDPTRVGSADATTPVGPGSAR